ncbi:unnamed protein product [Ectocarpus sp. CCAP 1310/34]|nr:unnamed protein product [Ectocarpus sp. CCAP 1310/34]
MEEAVVHRRCSAMGHLLRFNVSMQDLVLCLLDVLNAGVK